MKKVIDVPKITGTYADSLRAIGTANLLEEMTGKKTIIKDLGAHFQVECSADVQPEQWNAPTPGFYYIWRKSKEKEKPLGVLVLDYEEEQRRAKLKENNNNKEKILNKAIEEQGLLSVEPVHREYRSAAILESMRKGWSSDKDTYQWVYQNPNDALKCAQIKLSCLERHDQIEMPDVSNSQFFNPASGKGIHAAKTIYKSPGSINNEVVEPFAEWMKFRGAYNAMLPYRNGADFKIFVIEPREIAPRALAILRKSLMDLRLWGGIKLDIEATLFLAGELIRHSDAVEEAAGEISLRGKKPTEIIRGLRQAYFKNMGTAPSLMNDAFLSLPSWFRIEDIADAEQFLGIIREHVGQYENGRRKQGCLGSLDETRSGDVSILQQYRKWLTTGSEWDLLDFLAFFAVHVMERRGRKEWVKEFSAENMTILFTRRYEMKEIVENASFLNIASAIRNSTVSSFSNTKTEWKGSGFETQFGMSQEWKQKIKGGEQAFISALSEFAQKHNWEAVHKLKKSSPPISQDDLTQILKLIDQYGVELVGMLLLAYGYARASKIEIEINEEDK